MQAEELLGAVKAISKKYDLLYQKTGGYFNLFEIANIATYEIPICRVLCELLSPTGSHYQGHTYLKLFTENVLRMKIPDDELHDAKVTREYSVDHARRIDLVIDTKKHFIPIEVKIEAGDQEKQCYDYYQFAEKQNEKKQYEEKINLFYLTRFGDLPSQESAGELTWNKDKNRYEEVTQISFENDVLNWVYLCLADRETIKLAPIREVLQQFAAVIRKFSNQTEEDKGMEIKELLMQSSENMKSAVAIKDVIKCASVDMITKLFNEIKESIKQKRPDMISPSYWDYSEQAGSFYDKNHSSWPGINYLYKKNVKPNVDIWLRIEIDYKLYVGFCVAVDNKNSGNKELLKDEQIKQYLPVKLDPCGSWWLYTEYLPVDNSETAPNFKNFNNAFYDLFDSKKFEACVEACVKRFLELSPSEE
jgi:hypothetical protein